MDSITKELAIDIQKTINALPFAYQVELQDGKFIDNPHNSYI